MVLYRASTPAAGWLLVITNKWELIINRPHELIDLVLIQFRRAGRIFTSFDRFCQKKLTDFWPTFIIVLDKVAQQSSVFQVN